MLRQNSVNKSQVFSFWKLGKSGKISMRRQNSVNKSQAFSFWKLGKSGIVKMTILI